MTTEAGLLLVDKPAGATSHDVVLRVRSLVGSRSVGHTGTLDPFATGLLLALLGPFTRLAELFHALPKTYDATLELGRETDTGDPTGTTVSESSAWRERSPEELREALAARQGPGLQVPSAYSARKVRGRRAYEVARRGGRPDLAPTPVTVHALEPTAIATPRVDFRARVSTGTYIRALARDVGRDLGCGAHLTRLRRIAIGPFSVDDALRVDELDADAARAGPAWHRGAGIVPWLPRRVLTDEEAGAVAQGRAVPVGEPSPAPWPASELSSAEPLPFALVREDGLLAIAERRGEVLQPRKVFPA